MQTCRCRVRDWQSLRVALGYTREEMATLLCLGMTGIYKLEQSPHRCPREATVMMLRIWLQSPELQRKLELAGHPHPYPEDAVPALAR